MNWIRAHVFTPFYNQTREEKARLVFILAFIAVLGVGLGLWKMIHLAWQPTNLETPDPIYTSVQRSMTVLANLLPAISCFILAVLLGIIGYKWWVRTHTGRSACAWVKQGAVYAESEEVKAAKIRNQGTLQAAWILGSLLFFGLVLR